MEYNENSELEKEQVKTDDYKCPECGGPMHFNPGDSSLVCDFCNNKVIIKGEASSEELDLNAVNNIDNSWQNETHVLRCQSCGAMNVVSKKQMSITCPFCGSNQVVEEEEVEGMKPNRVIPFTLSSKDANVKYSKWISKKFYIPSKVKKQIPSLEAKGVYAPSWTYDANTFSSYKGRLGKRYTVTVGTGKNRRTETRIRYFTISGVKQVNFDDVLVNSGQQLSQVEINKLSPFSTNNSVVYDERFLAGFSSEHYSMDVKKGWNIAQDEMLEQIKREILSGYNYDVVDYLNVVPTYSNKKYKYVLLPIWIGNYAYGKKKYRFLVNGETGKMTGKYPISALKVSLTILILLVLAFVILYFVYLK